MGKTNRLRLDNSLLLPENMMDMVGAGIMTPLVEKNHED